MRLELLTLAPHLAPFVARAWHFESAAGIPSADLRTVVPNGQMKLVFPYRGALECRRQGALVRTCPEASVGVVGMQEEAVTIDGHGPLATIGIELQPGAAHRFFRAPLVDLTNGVFLAHEVVDRCDPHLGERLASAPTLSARVQVIETLLSKLLALGPRPDPIVEWTVAQLRGRDGGGVRVAELCKRLGYSKRYVDLRFAEHVGVSPKTLAAIFRFQRVFVELGAASTRAPRPPSALDLYYDQSHFIREFKRFSGRAPSAYLRERNDFGALFYRR
jgi:AraC-like DNA-binding protein